MAESIIRVSKYFEDNYPEIMMMEMSYLLDIKVVNHTLRKQTTNGENLPNFEVIVGAWDRMSNFDSVRNNELFWQSLADLILLIRTDGNKNTIREKISFLKFISSFDLEERLFGELEEMKYEEKELYFTVEHHRVLGRASFISKILFPIFHIYPQSNPMFKTFWNFIDENEWGILVRNKIEKIVYARVLSSIYADSRFWELAKLQGMTPFGWANQLTSKLMKVNIAVLDESRNAAIYIQVMSREALKWYIKSDFKMSFSVSVNYNEIKVLTESNIMHFLAIQKYIKKKFSENSKLSKYWKMLNQTPDASGEIKKREVTQVKSILVLSFLASELHVPVSSLVNIDKPSFSMVEVVCFDYLNSNQYPILTEIMKLIPENNSASVVTARLLNLVNIPEIAELESKFQFTSFTENHSIQKIIGSIVYNKYSTSSGFEIEFDKKELVTELVRFLNRISNT